MSLSALAISALITAAPIAQNTADAELPSMNVDCIFAVPRTQGVTDQTPPEERMAGGKVIERGMTLAQTAKNQVTLAGKEYVLEVVPHNDDMAVEIGVGDASTQKELLRVLVPYNGLVGSHFGAGAIGNIVITCQY